MHLIPRSPFEPFAVMAASLDIALFCHRVEDCTWIKGIAKTGRGWDSSPVRDPLAAIRVAAEPLAAHRFNLLFLFLLYEWVAKTEIYDMVPPPRSNRCS